jgi:hypothetical protein
MSTTTGSPITSLDAPIEEIITRIGLDSIIHSAATVSTSVDGIITRLPGESQGDHDTRMKGEFAAAIEATAALVLGVAAHLEHHRREMRAFVDAAQAADLSTAPGRRILAEALEKLEAAL